MEKLIGKQMGNGGTSTVYEWDKHEVIKIYKSHVTEDVINNEEYIVKILNKYPLEMPKYKRTVEIDGKKALIYERANGKAFFEYIIEYSDGSELAYKFAKLHYEIHKNSIEELPSQYEFLKRRIIELEHVLGERITTLLDLLDSISIEHNLCHGDYQPFNILAESYKSTVIDWNGACSGNPVLDVAWSYMTLNSPGIRHVLGGNIADKIADFSDKYLHDYCNLAELKKDQILKYLPIVAARRIYDNLLHENDISRQEKDWLHKIINQTF